MKKFIVFLCLWIFLIAGCSKNDTETEQPSSLEHGNDHLKNSYMINSEYFIYDDEDIYILRHNEDSSYSIMYLDSDNMIYTYLCPQLSCTHSDETCPSYVQPFDGCSYLAKQGEKIVLLTRGNNITIPPGIRTMSLSGDNPKKLIQFEMSQNLLSPYVLGDDSIYFVLQSTEETDSGAVSTVNYLMKVNTGTGKEDVIAVMNPTNTLIGAISDKFVMSEADNQQRAIYFMEQNGEKGEPVFIYDASDGIVFICDNKLYFIDCASSSICLINDDGTLTEYMPLPFSASVSTSFIRHITDSAIIMDNSVYNSAANDMTVTKYYIDLENKEVKTNNFTINSDGKNMPFTIYALQDDRVIGIIDYEYTEKVEFMDDGSSFTYTAQTPVFAKFDFDDFFSGNMEYTVFKNIG